MDMDKDADPDMDNFKIQWNLSYPNPLEPGVDHMFEKFITLKVHINNLINLDNTFILLS